MSAPNYSRGGFDSRIGWQHILSIIIPLTSAFGGLEIYQWQKIQEQDRLIAEQRTDIRLLQANSARSKEDVDEIKQGVKAIGLQIEQLRFALERKR